MGLGFLRFREQRFYSVKLGNLARDRLGTVGLAGALMTGATGVGAALTAGALPGWAGAAALVAIGLALTGRAKPLVSAFGLDEATALDLAWSHPSDDNGFRLVALDDLAANLGEVEGLYRNAGFSEAKLRNTFGKLEAIGMIKEAGGGRYQLIETIRVSGTDELSLGRG